MREQLVILRQLIRFSGSDQADWRKILKKSYVLILLMFIIIAKGYTETSRTAEEWFQEGRKAYEIEGYHLAVIMFQKALDLCPEDELIYFNLGLAYTKKKEYDEAKSCYEKAIEINPVNPLPYYHIGRVYYETDDTEKEMEWYQKAIEVDPDFVLAYYNMEIIYYNLGDKLNEEMCSQKVLDFGADNIIDFNKEGEVYSQKGWNNIASENFFQAGLIFIEQYDSLKALKILSVMDSLKSTSELNDSLRVIYNLKFRRIN